ncbi:hypothetical protein [Chryseobacterium sp.]|uniref:hypothetical protein n=1 Tax=Chryseobacterium sp. TaxID=1871047 RepID=UPI002FC5F0C0
MTDLKFDKIKKRNLDFSLVYSKNGNSKNYTEILNWSEIEKPKDKNIEVQKIVILENHTPIKTLTKKESEKIILILNFHNNKPQNK